MLTAAEQTAITKLKLKADRLPVGEHRINTVVHIKGTIKVGADYMKTPTVSVPLKETLALFIAYSGVTRKAATDALVKAMKEAIAATDKGEGELAKSLPVVEETLETVSKEILAKLPKTKANGAITTKLEVEALSDILAKRNKTVDIKELVGA